MFFAKLKLGIRIKQKLLEKHHVIMDEVYECFLNRTKGFLEDTRLEHKTDPPTLWFVSETDVGRVLKIVFIEHNDGSYEIKTAYEPNTKEIVIYEKYA